MAATAPVVMVLGRAGTGKTTLVRQLRVAPGREQVVLAYTGVAALNAGGQTLHSFFGLPWAITELNEIHPSRRLRDIAPHLDRIIIDEISMVRADIIDAIDRSLKVARGSELPFGGVQIVFVGDFLQLPPIVNRREREALEQLGYPTVSPIAAKCLQNIKTQVVHLHKVYRQTDPNFINLLGSVRRGDDLDQVIPKLNDLCCRNHRTGYKPLLLTCSNEVADLYNQNGLSELPGPLTFFTGTIAGEFERKEERLPAPLELALKVNARVMMVRNDPAHRWVNGTLGTVSRLSRDGIWVRLDRAATEVEIQREHWESIRYNWNDLHHKLESEVVGTYSQFPLKLAWASTIHKAQGCTLEDVRLDLTGGAFETGQAYVALSRVTSLDGLSFRIPMRVADVKVDQIMLDILDRLTPDI